MRRLFVALVFLLVFSLLTVSPQVRANSGNYWAKGYDGVRDDAANTVALGPNGDIIVAGETHSFSADDEEG